MKRKANLNTMYNEYLRVAGINSEGLMTDEEKVERKRSFMAGVHFFTKFINDNLNRLTSAKAGDILKDVDRQLKIYWKQEYDRNSEVGGRDAMEGEFEE